MPENVIGANATDIVHQKKTLEGSLTITHKTFDPIALTIGHLLAIPNTHLPLWTPNAIFRNPPKELTDQLFDRWKDVPWKGDVLVRVGHTALFRDIQRIWNIDKIGGPFGFHIDNPQVRDIARVLYSALAIPLSTLSTFITKLSRADHYNPFTNTVNVYHPRLAVGMHEIGHAEFFTQEPAKTIYALFGWLPIVRSFKEMKATVRAMPKFKNDAERRQALKILEPAWGTYLATDVFAIAAPFAGPLGAAFATGTLWLTRTVGIKLASIGGAIAGHFMARGYPRQDQRFGYVFAGLIPEKKSQPELLSRQVFVATARPAPVAATESLRQFTASGDRNGKQKLHSNYSRNTF